MRYHLITARDNGTAAAGLIPLRVYQSVNLEPY